MKITNADYFHQEKKGKGELIHLFDLLISIENLFLFSLHRFIYQLHELLKFLDLFLRNSVSFFRCNESLPN